MNCVAPSGHTSVFDGSAFASRRPEGDKDGAAAAYAAQAEAAFGHGEFDDACHLAKCAVAAARARHDPYTLGWGLMILGRAESVAGRSIPAYAAAAEAYELLGTCGDTDRQLWALNTCAIICELCGDTGRSIDMWRFGLSSAKGSARGAVRASMLTNLGTRLLLDREFDEAIECAHEAEQLTRANSSWHKFYAAALAEAHVRFSDDLRLRGSDEQAREQLRKAERALPLLDPRSWRSLIEKEIGALPLQVDVLAALDRRQEARSAAAASICIARRQRGSPRLKCNALTTLFDMYRRQGQWERAARYAWRLLEVFRTLGGNRDVLLCLQGLSDIYAKTGWYPRALAVRKEWRELHTQQRRETLALRCRLATLERQAERRLLEAQQKAAHGQRLVVIGRLIGQTQHALGEPIGRCRRLTAQALSVLEQTPQQLKTLRPLLQALNEVIDQAAGLISQLKLFSYRSTVQPTVVPLDEAMQRAWAGLGPHVADMASRLTLEHALRLEVWSDEQRLIILLTLLLIELSQQAGGRTARATIRVQAGKSDQAMVRLQMTAVAAGAQGMPADQRPVTIGAALCAEIAAEMGGSLQRLDLPDGPGYCLLLPDATAKSGPPLAASALPLVIKPRGSAPATR